MKRLPLLAVAIGLVALLVPAGALAKGASEATITGPGLDQGITLAGEGQVGGEQLMQIAEQAGFFPAVFQTSPNPMQAARPEGRLGPRYVIEYAMPGPNNELDVIRQELYPYAELDSYAESAPVTYVEPGQRFFGSERTVGGWFVASRSLEEALVAVGLPESAPTDGSAPDGPPWELVVAAALAAILAVVGVLLVRTRRRSSPATA
jgi:hypothetical protein